MKLDEILGYFATAPWLVGLATLGGLISLVVFVVQGLRFLASKRTFVLGTIRSRKRRAFLRDVKDFKVATQRKKAGHSDLVIAYEKFHAVGVTILNVLGDAIVAGVNTLLFAITTKSTLNLLPAVLFMILAAVGLRKAGRLFNQGFVMIGWANFPDHNKARLIEQGKKLLRWQ